MIYAVIDTNVIVSAILTKNLEHPTVQIMKAVLDKRLIPLYDNDIMSEYTDVLHRQKFGFADNVINVYLDAFKKGGIPSHRVEGNDFPLAFFKCSVNAR